MLIEPFLWTSVLFFSDEITDTVSVPTKYKSDEFANLRERTEVFGYENDAVDFSSETYCVKTVVVNVAFFELTTA